MELIQLKKQLKRNIRKLSGSWIKNNSSYDRFISEIVGFHNDPSRYWDAVHNELKIEYKKGKSIWIDLVRYSEIINQINDSAKIDTVTLFFVPNNDKEFIQEIICIETNKIIVYLNLDKNYSTTLIELSKSVPRSLNAQVNLTLADVRMLSDFIITID